MPIVVGWAATPAWSGGSAMKTDRYYTLAAALFMVLTSAAYLMLVGH